MGGETRQAIMRATFDALSEHGYADLTMQAIADEFDKSKSLLHYHFDSKDELLAAFLADALEEFLEQVESDRDLAPADQLRRIARLVVYGIDEVDEDDARAYHAALLGLRAQAPHDERLREQFVENDEAIREAIADVVREGQRTGQFRESVDPAAFAALFRSAIEGVQSHEVILGEDAPTETAMAGVESLLVGLVLEGEPAGEGSA